MVDNESLSIIKAQQEMISKLRTALGSIRWNNSHDARTIKNALAETMIPVESFKEVRDNPWNETSWLTQILLDLSKDNNYAEKDKLASQIRERILKESNL